MLKYRSYADIIYSACHGAVLTYDHEHDGVLVMNQSKDLAFFIERGRMERLTNEEFSEWVRETWNRLVLISVEGGTA